MAIDAVLAPTLTPWLVQRFGLVRVIAAGMALGVAGYALSLRIGTQSGYVASMLPTMVLIGMAWREDNQERIAAARGAYDVRAQEDAAIHAAVRQGVG